MPLPFFLFLYQRRRSFFKYACAGRNLQEIKKMQDPRTERLADVLINYSLGVKKGDLMVIQAMDVAAPLVKAAFREAIRAGAHVTTRIVLDGLAEIFYKEASEEQLSFVSPFKRFETEKPTVVLSLWGGANPKELTGVAPQRVAMNQKANSELTRIFMERSTNGELRWCGAQFPNSASAQEADMSLADYEDFVFKACFVDRPDPVAEWKKVAKEQERMVQFLNTKKTIRVEGKDTDLTVNVAGRKWINCCGQMNMPDGEVFTGPVEDSAQGVIRFTYPAVYGGREVVDVRLTFKDGVVTEAKAEKGEEMLKTMIAMDEGSRRIGEFALGTNYGIQRFTKDTLFDEKIGGTIHVALGFSLPESGGKNLSGIHWDMVCDLKSGGRMFADGEMFYENGKFLI
jgi:aminopeptidase